MRTKIIATLGPSSDSYETLKAMTENGLDIVRANFSHATHPWYSEMVKTVRKVSKDTGKNLKILADLQGPRMRVNNIPPEGKMVVEGEKVVFTTNKKNTKAIYIDNPYLHLDLKVKDPLFLLNGDIECVVTKISGKEIYTTVVRGGKILPRKGVNTPHTKLRISGLTKKDKEDVQHILKEGADYIAISFVQTADDVIKLKKSLPEGIKVISKIETNFALQNIDSIIKASDAIMIARGDLAIEIPREKVPFVQKHLIKHCIWHRKPSITATQMLTSMMNHPVPTRAEVSDVANAVWDGTDVVMLSDETAMGSYPVESVRELRKITMEAEKVLLEREYSLDNLI